MGADVGSERRGMRYIIVTGMSGAGKTSVIHALEDLGYFCVDNLPPSLIPRFIELWKSDPNTEENAAFGVDIRSRQYFNQLALVLQDMREKGIQVEVLFLDCRDEELSRRYKTTRRIHPLQASDRRIRRLEQALSLERKYLAPMRERADYLIDTSDVNVWQTRQMIQRLFGEKQEEARLRIQVTSFGYTRGIPVDCDLVFDVRFMPNPHYVEALREHTGKEKPIQEYVMQDGNGEKFLQKVLELLEFLVPLYQKEGKSQLIIGIGCTGGRHRSVTMAILLAERLCQKGMDASCYHRDVAEEPKPTSA